MRCGGAWVMVSIGNPAYQSPADLGFDTQFVTIFVEDVEAHFAKTRAAGAKIVEELNGTIYGELQYRVEDIEGHKWLFSRHIRDVDPADWGASLAPGL